MDYFASTGYEQCFRSEASCQPFYRPLFFYCDQWGKLLHGIWEQHFESKLVKKKANLEVQYSVLPIHPQCEYTVPVAYIIWWISQARTALHCTGETEAPLSPPTEVHHLLSPSTIAEHIPTYSLPLSLRSPIQRNSFKTSSDAPHKTHTHPNRITKFR